jgi:hypothetical protein
VAALVLDYYLVLRSVLRKKPQLRTCLCRCRQCRIFFLTDPRNVWQRALLRCPFGCQIAHERQESTRRSTAYNRSPEGKRKKSALNQRRGRILPPMELEPQPEPEPKIWDERMVKYVRMVSSLLEGRWVSREEVLEMLAKQMRQHSMRRRRWVDYSIAWLNERPP